MKIKNNRIANSVGRIELGIAEVLPNPLTATVNVKVTGAWLYWLRLKSAVYFLWAAAAIASAIGRLEVEIKT